MICKIRGGALVQSFFNNLFRKKPSINSSPSDSDVPTELYQPDDHEKNAIKTTNPIQSASAAKLHLETSQIIVGIAQSIGIKRDKNEDSVFTLTTNLISSQKTINFGLYIIADGMGGHENGELASNLAVGKLASHVINTFYLPSISSESDHLETSIHEVLQTGIKDAHQSIREKVLGGGTTLTAALILGEHVTIAHVGDCRAYFVNPDGNMQVLTHDHSLVKRLEEIGQISPEEAASHPNRNLLYRALGQGEPFEPDITSLQVNPGCELLLCSDGLWGVVTENDISNILCSSAEPQLACQSLIHAANAAGGPDNISVIIVHFPD
jgi:serine/threonine protein phosphatase PrpC